MSDAQLGVCPTRNTNQPIYILRHILTAKLEKKKLIAAFLDLSAAYDSVQGEKYGPTFRTLLFLSICSQQ